MFDKKCVIKVINQSSNPLPTYKTTQAAGMDIHAHLTAPMIVSPLARVLVPSGLFIALPNGFEATVRPRSGLAIRHGITVLNSPGTIDADYRGEIKILLINLSDKPFTIQHGERIAQLVIHPCVQASWEKVPTLPATERGTGGFGSTGMQ